MDEIKARQIVEGRLLGFAGEERELRLVMFQPIVRGDGAILGIQISGQTDPNRVLKLTVNDDTLKDEKRLRDYVEHFATRFLRGDLPPDAIEQIW